MDAVIGHSVGREHHSQGGDAPTRPSSDVQEAGDPFLVADSRSDAHHRDGPRR